MKWREPWLETLKSQDSFNPISMAQIKNGAVWAVIFSAIGIASATAKGVELDIVIGRLWMIIPLGFGISFLLYAIEWLSPWKVTSGPRGIVRSRSGNMILLPWVSIANYEFIPKNNVVELRITLVGAHEAQTLLLPHDANINEIKEELGRMTNENP